jgi:flagellar biogenesis protein FliO
MLVYLVPMLLLIVGSLHLLRRFQQRSGRLPWAFPISSHPAAHQGHGHRAAGSGGLGSQLVSALQRPKSGRQTSSAIRLVETVPLGATNLYLIEVHGRMLLLGSSGGNVSLLTEIEEQAGIQADEFRTMLRAAAADMDALDLEDTELPATTMITALEGMLHETGEAVTSRLRRLRTVSDYEEDVHA